MVPPDIRSRFAARTDSLSQAIRTVSKAVGERAADSAHPDQKPRALLVGGYVRDLILDIPSKDADIEVFGVLASELRPILERLFPGQVLEVGKSFGIYKVHLADGSDLDVALPRSERKSGVGHKAFEIDSDPFLSLDRAARRRDFTVNAIYFDALSGEVSDPANGVADLASHVLRVVDVETFGEDPLRAFRAMQFVARFKLEPEAESLNILKKMVASGETDELSRERIGEEMKKLLLKSDRPSIGLEFARQIGLIDRHFHSLAALVGTPQEPEWHPEGDVWIHTRMVVDEAVRLCGTNPELTETQRLQAIFGALGHDLGKPSTTQTIEGRIRSRGHEEAGKPLARALAQQLAYGEDIAQAAEAIAGDHLKPTGLWSELQHGVLNETSYANAVRRLLRRILPLDWRVFLIACEADWRGRGVPGRHEAEYVIGKTFEEAVARENLAHQAATPLLQGRDLIQLGIEPGPRMGEIIRQIEEMRDAGTLRTSEEAIEAAKKLI